MNNDVYSLSVMIAALRDNVYVTEVVRGSGGGYELRLSDGSKIVIADGKDGEISDFPITTYEEWLYP